MSLEIFALNLKSAHNQKTIECLSKSPKTSVGIILLWLKLSLVEHYEAFLFNMVSCSKQSIPSKDHLCRDNMLLISALSVKLDY